MKFKTLIIALLLVSTLMGCKSSQVSPGVYAVAEPADIPFPTSGYDVYFLGEEHGSRETKLVLINYLQRLYKEAGLRDIILEEDQVYETAANDYIHGITDSLSAELCLRADVLGKIRDFNATLPADEQVTVHLVDVDSPLDAVYAHLKTLHEQLGPAAEGIPIPDMAGFEKLGPGPAFELVDSLIAKAENHPDTLDGLQTVRFSLRWYYFGNRMGTGKIIDGQNAIPLREDAITANIQFLLDQLKGKPVLAYFGAAHGMKVEGSAVSAFKDFKDWVQRISENGVRVYSIDSFGASGSVYWRGGSYAINKVFKAELEKIQLSDERPVISLFDTHTDSQFIYVDLAAPENASMRLTSNLKDIPAAQMYDGLLFFREFTPMENACP